MNESTEALYTALVDFEAGFCVEDPSRDILLDLRGMLDKCSELLKDRIRTT